MAGRGRACVLRDAAAFPRATYTKCSASPLSWPSSEGQNILRCKRASLVRATQSNVELSKPQFVRTRDALVCGGPRAARVCHQYLIKPLANDHALALVGLNPLMTNVVVLAILNFSVWNMKWRTSRLIISVTNWVYFLI